MKLFPFLRCFHLKYRDKLSKYLIDMFNNDIVIERFWKNPEKYLPLSKKYLLVYSKKRISYQRMDRSYWGL